MKLVYFITLVISSLILGWYVEIILNNFGYVANATSSMYTIFLVSFGFASLQCAFMGMMKLFQPAHTDTIYGVEIFSLGLIAILLPLMAGISIPWPHPSMKKIEFLLFLSVFFGLHGISKLATFYAFLQAPLESRKSVPFWIGSSAACALFALFLVNVNLNSIEAARPVPDTSLSVVQVGPEWARGMKLQEGASLSREISPETIPASIRFLWAPTRAYAPEKIYITFHFYGGKESTYTTSANLHSDRWSTTTVPHSEIPSGCYRYDVYWTHEAEPNWVSIFKIRPVSYGDNWDSNPNMVWAAGPIELPFAQTKSNYNLLFLMVEGLGSNHVGEFGYDRNVTPNIDSLIKKSTTRLNGNSNAKDLDGYITSLLGLETPNGLVDHFEKNGYATAAFTELENYEDATMADASYANEHGLQWLSHDYSSKGSLDTLQRVEEWLHNNRENNFMLFVRLSELVHERSNASYKKVFPTDGQEKDIDAFDNALISLDSGIGGLVQYIKGQKWGKRTIIVLTSPYGQEFSLGLNRRKLDRKSNRTPIIINIPGKSGRTRSVKMDIAALHETLNSYFSF